MTERPSPNYLNRIYIGIIALPWIWLTVMGLFILAVTLEFGNIPSFSTPDPKDAFVSPMFYPLVLILFFVVLTSTPFWVMFTTLSWFNKISLRIRALPVITYVTGIALALFVMTGSFGIWLMD